ncbi:hypothetical protein [Nostoc sp.]|uniref:hypothetical protein n=1 Tax=Nostoc sp. TaxID=1180 RepID=UPI002FFD15A7
MVNWHILALVLEADILILLLLLVQDDNTTGTRGEGHITYFDLYIYYRSTDAVWLKNLLTMYFDNSEQ